MKIFCVGFQKSGTTSLESALQMLGFTVASVYGRKLSLAELQARYVSLGLARARTVDAVQDMPWPLLYRELDKAFPDAKFVLSVRDEDAWWSSILGHFGNNADVMQALVYGEDAAAPLGNEERYRRVYREHNQRVRQYFSDRPGKLLEMDFSRPVSWEPLCRFLDCPVPDRPFPKSNQPKQKPTLRRKLRRYSMSVRNWLSDRFAG
ncbi:MAG: sulfotransferase family protein [Pseudomonadota bacterium]